MILVSDGRGGSVEQNAFVNVRSVPDAPVAQNFSVFVEAGTNFNRIYSINELVSDPDSDALQFVSVYGLYRLANIVDNKLIMKDLNGAVDIYYTVSDELFETTGMIRLDYYFN